MLGIQPQAPLLGGYQAILHDMRDADARVHANDTGGALERVGRAHARLELVSLGRVALECHQAGAEYLGLRFGLQAEQLEQRGVAHLLWGHDKLRCTAASKC